MASKDKQIAIVDAGNRQVESESTEETTLTEIHKDTGHTKSSEKKADFEEHNKESIVEDHRTEKSESNKQVSQSVKHEVSTDGRQQNTLDKTPNFENTQNSSFLKPFTPMEPFGTITSPENLNFPVVSDTQNREEKNEQTEVKIKSPQEEHKDEGTNLAETYKLPDYYKPVEILTPSELSEFLVNTSDSINNGSSEKLPDEFKNKKIENSLREIISDLDYYTEKEMELKDSGKNYPDKWKYQDENSSNSINVDKILTPAQENELEMAPKKKMFANSAFYAKGLHPTMEEQVESAKRISSSSSDISNQTSKGQSMYVNRKKRSVKWVHEGKGEGTNGFENNNRNSSADKNPSKLVMNPHGQVQDIFSLGKQGYKFESALSPDICSSIVKDSNSPKGKGAELFAKRRKRSEKWVVEEKTEPKRVNDSNLIETPIANQPSSPFYSPNYSPGSYNNLNGNQDTSVPKVKLIKSPWEAALETGSVEAAFESYPSLGLSKGNFVAPAVESYESASRTGNSASSKGVTYNGHTNQNKVFAHNPAYNSSSINRVVDNLKRGISNVDVYKPTLPAAWNTRSTPSDSYNQQSYQEQDKGIEVTNNSNLVSSQNDQSESLNEFISDESSRYNPIETTTPDRSSFPETGQISGEDTKTLRNMDQNQMQQCTFSPYASYSNIPDVAQNSTVSEPKENTNPNERSIPYWPCKPAVSSDKLNIWQPSLKTTNNATKPEFGYAFNSGDSKVVENSFTRSTSNLLTFQSANFESEGHFVADRAKSPLPIFIPESHSLPEEPAENLTVSIQPLIQYTVEETKNPIHEDHVREMVMSGNKEKRKVIQGQKTCFSELQEIEDAYRYANYPLSGPNVRNVRLMEKVHAYTPVSHNYDKEEEEWSQDSQSVEQKAHTEDLTDYTEVSKSYIEDPKAYTEDWKLSTEDERTHTQDPSLYTEDSRVYTKDSTDDTKDSRDYTESAKDDTEKTRLYTDDSRGYPEYSRAYPEDNTVYTGDSRVFTENSKSSTEDLFEYGQKHSSNVSKDVNMTGEGINVNQNINSNNKSGIDETKEDVGISRSVGGERESSLDQIVEKSVEQKESIEGHGRDVNKCEKNSKLDFQNQNKASTKRVEETSTEESYRISKPICKKAPQAVIGARPLFGQSDINKEFLKAFTGKEKSMKTKKNREIFQCTQKASTPRMEQGVYVTDSGYNQNSSVSSDRNQNGVVKIGATNQVDGRQEKMVVGDNGSSKISSRFKNDQNSTIEIVRPSESEEIEKIYYQRERALSIDLQTIGGDLHQSDIQAIIDKEISKVSAIPTENVLQKCYSEVDQHQLKKMNASKSQDYTDTYGHNDDFEEYRKVPVRSIIENFEQHSMPPLKIKEQNYPLSVTDKARLSQSLSSTHAIHNLEERRMYASRAAQSARVQNLHQESGSQNNGTLVYKSEEMNKQEIFQHSENSFFREYDQYDVAPQRELDCSYLADTKTYSSAFSPYRELSQDSLPRQVYKPQINPPAVFTESRISDHNIPISKSYSPQYVPQETVASYPSYSNSNAAIRSVAAPEPIKKIDFSSLHNYNTAPRGWTRNENVYKPITFTSYSDF